MVNITFTLRTLHYILYYLLYLCIWLYSRYSSEQLAVIAGWWTLTHLRAGTWLSTSADKSAQFWQSIYPYKIQKSDEIRFLFQIFKYLTKRIFSDCRTSHHKRRLERNQSRLQVWQGRNHLSTKLSMEIMCGPQTIEYRML